MFGYLIPRCYTEALEFDKANNNHKWYDATRTEMESIHSYHVFNKHEKAKFDRHRKVINSPPGYQKIRVHIIFAVKYDGRHKARLPADGHLPLDPVESIYSGVVSLRNLRLVIFLGKLTMLELWGADIGNACLEAVTEEKLRYLGVLMKTKSYLFGDNRSVVTSSTLPHSTLGKRHNILAYHHIKEAIASNILSYHWIQTGYYLSDMLSKHLDHPSVYNMIIKLLITRGPITLIP